MENTELCRLCAIEKDTFVDGFVNIYSDEGQKFGLEGKIVKCLQIELCSSDTLPKSVCLECCTKLHQCADFVESSARAQTRLKSLLGSTVKSGDEAASSVKEDTGKSSLAVNSTPQGQVHREDSDKSPSASLECVLDEKTKSTGHTQKQQEASLEKVPSRASKRKCRLPVRVSIQHGLEDEITDIDNVDIDAAEISRIFADDDDDYDDSTTRRKRRSRKKRASKASKKKVTKPKLKKVSAMQELEEEDIDASEKEGSENIKADLNGETVNGGGGLDIESEEKTKGKAKPRKKTEENMELIAYQWMCTDCSEEITDLEALETHHSEVHQQSPKYLCTTCSKVCTKYATFVAHVRRHLDYRKFCCETCGKCFSNKKAVESHRTIHSDRKPHVCTVCGKAFRQQSALYVHSRCHLPEELKNKYACDQCDKRFSTKPNLVTHKRIHTGIRNFTCDQCGKSFVQKGNLDAHLLTHTTVKPFSCQICNKSFKTELQLRKHGSVHTGVKPHQCDICGRQFRERGTLREHHRIHTGAMPFSCEFCGKSFRFKGVLTTHRRQHTGERPYSCLECQHHFTNWPNYNKHMKRRHGINTSRQSRSSPNVDIHSQLETNIPQPTPQPSIAPDQLQLPQQVSQPQPQQNHQQHHVSGPASLPLSALCAEPQLQPQPSALIHKIDLETHQHMYNHDNTLSQHSLHSQEEDSLSSHHEIYSNPPIHSPQLAHSGHTVHPVHITHSALSPPNEEEREVRYVTEREVLLGQMVRERDRPHFYNPAPGASVNTNPYLHQSLHQSLHLQQAQLPLPGLYAIPQLSLDPSHLEMLHSSAAQHR